MKCEWDGSDIDPTKDFFITINERKAASVNLCSRECFDNYMEDI